MKDTKRSLLKAVSAAGIVGTWKNPVVESILLPAHAITSFRTSCTAPAGCYQQESSTNRTYLFPGGSVADDVNLYGDPDFGGLCEEENLTGTVSRVIAAQTQQEAQSLCPDPQEVASLISSTPTSGCFLYYCVIPACVGYGARVHMLDGSTKAIEKIECGDILKSSPSAPNVGDFGVVTGVIRNHKRDRYYLINNALEITDDHPMLRLEDGKFVWTRVDLLRIGNTLKTVYGEAEVKSVQLINKSIQTVYLDTTNDHFIVSAAGSDPFVVQSGYAAEYVNSRREVLGLVTEPSTS